MLIPVILSGGAGTRLWPVSREAHPKPFIQLPDGQSLLQKSFLRASSLAGVSEVLTVTNRDYYFKTKDDYQDCATGVKSTFLLEPCSRNTMPAVVLAALQIKYTQGPESILLVLPADHLISDQAAFAQAVGHAVELATEGHLVTFGIHPTAPETGFGYVEAGGAIATKLSVIEGSPLIGTARTARRFVEKPDAGTAAEYLAAGNFYWNSGMFCFQAATLLSAMETICPATLAAAQDCWAASCRDNPALIELDPSSFAAQPDISIDYAVMEKADNVAVVPCDLGWSDIGTWNALSELVAADGEGNRILGEAVLVGSNNNYVQTENHLVAVVGVDDLIIVDTQDTVLVAHKNRTQDVKQVVAQLKQRGHEAYRLHRTVTRPWGTYTVLEEGKHFKIKRIEVKPGASLSLQMHHHRSEHWIVVSGMAKVTNGERELFVNTNESTYIPAGHKHRLENPGILDLVMIEVQSGEYLGEDDIVRFDDIYGRN